METWREVCSTMENLEISNHVENKYIENRKYMMIIAGTETRGHGVTVGIYNIYLVLMNGVESIHIYIIYTIRTTTVSYLDVATDKSRNM